jgi:hypothetical protein
LLKPESKPQTRILDERTASLFNNDHQFHAFREAVTTRAAQKVIPVDQQYALAKSIHDPHEGGLEVRQFVLEADVNMKGDAGSHPPHSKISRARFRCASRRS